MGRVLAENAKDPGWRRESGPARAHGSLPDLNAIAINEGDLIVDIDDNHDRPGR
jgi:hypothetical protein